MAKTHCLIIGWIRLESHGNTLDSSNKKLFIGVDEAGYGPNLGPLVIAATVWQTSNKMSETKLCNVLSNDFTTENWVSGGEHIPLGDSKKLYQPGKGLITLETGLLSLLELVNSDDECQQSRPQHVQELISSHVVASKLATQVPWYEHLHKFEIPRNQTQAEITRLGELAKQRFKHAEIELIKVRALLITEYFFNMEVDRSGSKGHLLSQSSLKLVADLLSEYSQSAEVFCDRQGGRKNYMPILMDTWPEDWFIQTAASNQRCSYRRSTDRSIDIHFSVGGDRFPPTALASMFAKYLRERLMESFNAFWLREVPGIKPTAGYPQDAKRFRKEIESRAAKLGLNSDHWWRCK